MTQTATGFAERLRAATWHDHDAAEHATFMDALLAGTVPRAGYAQMVAQHYFAYVALEKVGHALRDDPVAGAFVFPELERVPALEHDLRALYGDAWRERITPSPPTRTYVARIEQMADWPGGFIAHHYTRYLGDLSGGQIIRRAAERAYDLRESAGVGFYLFSRIPDSRAFKAEYRDRLNALAPDEVRAKRIIGETLLAYQFNTEVLDELGTRLPDFHVA